MTIVIRIPIHNHISIFSPKDNQYLWGYMTVETERGTFADGEVHMHNLNKSMYSYANTMLNKRAEDRAILKELRLYEWPNNWYAQDEFGGGKTIEEYDNLEPKAKLFDSEEEKVLVEARKKLLQAMEEYKKVFTYAGDNDIKAELANKLEVDIALFDTKNYDAEAINSLTEHLYSLMESALEEKNQNLL